MNLEYPEQCLICLDAISKSVQEEAESGERYSNFSCSFVAQNFQQLCEYLRVDFPVNSMKFKNVSKTLKAECKNNCESLLCEKCMEMVNDLGRMYGDLRRIQRRIDFGIRSIQDVIKQSDEDEKKDNDSDLTVTNGKSDGDNGNDNCTGSNGTQVVKKPNRRAMVSSSSVVADYFEFVDTFRNLVKDVVTVKPEPVVLSEEAAALAKSYQQLDDDDSDDFKPEVINIEESSSPSSPILPKVDEESIKHSTNASEESKLELNTEILREAGPENGEGGEGEREEGTTQDFRSLLTSVDVSVVSDDEDDPVLLEDDFIMESVDEPPKFVQTMSTNSGLYTGNGNSFTISPIIVSTASAAPTTRNIPPQRFIGNHKRSSLSKLSMKSPYPPPPLLKKPSTTIKCPTCLGPFDNTSDYLQHRHRGCSTLTITKSSGVKASQIDQQRSHKNGGGAVGDTLPVRICTVCRQSFTSLSALRNHMISDHQAETSNPAVVMCNVCGKRFSNAFSLSAHKRGRCKS